MAKAIRNTSALYCTLVSLLDGDVERLNRSASRIYLRRGLLDLEERIHNLYAHCDATVCEGLESFLGRTDRAEDLWRDLVELSYLEASREVLQEALDCLP